MSQQQSKSFANLEVLRFAAAFAVVLYHYKHFALVGHTARGFDISAVPFYDALRPLYLRGFLAVDLFWILSGFIFFSQYLSSIAGGRIDAREFSVRRFSRLYPLHLATALFVFVAQFAYVALTPANTWYVYRSNSLNDLVLHLVFASQWDESRTYTLNGPVWSVSLEILAYISFFIVAKYLRRPGLIVAAAPAVLVLGVIHKSPLFTMLACFYLGGGVWFATARARAMSRHLRWGAVSAALAAMAALLWRSRASTMHRIEMTALDALSVLIAFALVIFALATIPQLQGRWSRGASTLGSMTYSSYLVHFPLQLTLAILAGATQHSIPWRNPVLLVGYMVGVGVVALVVYRQFELPWQQRIRQTGSDQRRSP